MCLYGFRAPYNRFFPCMEFIILGSESWCKPDLNSSCISDRTVMVVVSLFSSLYLSRFPTWNSGFSLLP